jgi:outer membrane protein assembly factor BamE (lipoprotein component of BamABCDE complex)
MARRATGHRAAILAGAAALALAACSPVVEHHGYAPSPEQLAQVEPGADTAASVASKIGRPSTGGVIRDDSWYYISSRVETLAYNAPEVTDRRVVAVSFDDAGLVNGVESFGLEEGRAVTLVTRTTPTFGRELTVLQQIFGNIGNIGAAQLEDRDASIPGPLGRDF